MKLLYMWNMPRNNGENRANSPPINAFLAALRQSFRDFREVGAEDRDLGPFDGGSL